MSSRPEDRRQVGLGRTLAHLHPAPGSATLPVILDACDRKVVGYAISMLIDTPLALAALQAAIHSQHPARGCIHHTYRGSQYESDSNESY